MYALNCTSYKPFAHAVAGEGCFVIGQDGKRYADFESGVWCACLGHSHPDISRALQEQSGKIGHLGYRFDCAVVEQAAEMLLRHLPFPDGKCVFLSSGSEAVEFAVQTARRVTGQEKRYTLCLQDYFLSSYGHSSARPAEEWVTVASPADAGEDWRARLEAIPFEQIGAFVLEPGNASGMVRLPPKPFISYIAEQVQAHGGLLVVDEVTTGIGRTGKWFGFEYYDIAPDIVAFGKGVGNGYPVSGVAMRGAVAEQLLAGDFHYAQSHQNDPMGCAVICAVLSRILADGLVQNAAKMGDYLYGALTSMQRENRWIEEVRGRGLLLAVGLSADAPAAALHGALFEKGYVLGLHEASRTLRIYPPLILEKPLADSFLKAFWDTLTEQSI